MSTTQQQICFLYHTIVIFQVLAKRRAEQAQAKAFNTRMDGRETEARFARKGICILNAPHRKPIQICSQICSGSSPWRKKWTTKQARWCVMRYKGGEPPLMICTVLRTAMICQACGLDKKERSNCFVLFCVHPTISNLNFIFRFCIQFHWES